MKPFVHELSNFNPLSAFAAVSHIPYSLLLDSADTGHPDGRYSYICCKPIETLETKNGKTTITNWDAQTTFESCPFTLLQSRINTWIQNAETIKELPPFQGGAAGFFGYDLGRQLENIKEDTPNNQAMPDMAIGIYDQVLAHDNKTKQSWIITHARNKDEARTKQKHLLRLFAQEPERAGHSCADLPWEPVFDTHDYKENIKKIISYINEGDIFQANMTQRFDAELPENFAPFEHYLNLREVNPAPFAGFMDLGQVKISSASPERFISINDGNVQTRPIKGTRPHVEDTKIDQRYRDALINSEKDNAENTMIVDLLRNDLSKVCEMDSVEVTELCKLETFASVHHLVSTIKGKLKPTHTPLDLMRACFPGGSITGAPKIRAMEIIEELEQTRRGPYCGSLAFIGFDGTMDSNILIRTLVYEGNNVSLQAGGGITADSNADDEYQELFDKAEALFRSFEHNHTIHRENIDIECLDDDQFESANDTQTPPILKAIENA